MVCIFFFFFNSVHRDSFFVVRDLVKLSPIPINQQQLPFGNAQQNATWSCSGIIEVEDPPSFLDLPSPQVKSWEQPTADMTRHIRCIAETLSHGTATESSPALHSEGYAFKENKQKGDIVRFLKVIFKHAKTNNQKQTNKKKKFLELLSILHFSSFLNMENLLLLMAQGR